MRVALLAVRAHQAADGIVPPPGRQRAGADVGLAERGRVVVPRDAAGQLTPGGGRLIRSPKTARPVTATGPGERVSAPPSASPGSARPGARPGNVPSPGRGTWRGRGSVLACRGVFFAVMLASPNDPPAWPRGAVERMCPGSAGPGLGPGISKRPKPSGDGTRLSLDLLQARPGRPGQCPAGAHHGERAAQRAGRRAGQEVSTCAPPRPLPQLSFQIGDGAPVQARPRYPVTGQEHPRPAAGKAPSGKWALSRANSAAGVMLILGQASGG